MHLKKTKKTPRMFRMIALMLSLVLVFFTMTGMALAEEGTDVSDAAPDSTLEIVETELEVEPEPTEEPPAETPGAEETPFTNDGCFIFIHIVLCFFFGVKIGRASCRERV